MSSRWSKRRRGGRLRFIEQQRDTRPANVFSRAPSIKGIFMQRAKVIRSLGMHIARASHGLLPSLSLTPSPLPRGSRERDRERENGLEPVPKGPARKRWLPSSSVRLLSIHSTPPPHYVDVSQSTRRWCRRSKGYGIIVYVGHTCRNEKSWRYAAILQPRWWPQPLRNDYALFR